MTWAEVKQKYKKEVQRAVQQELRAGGEQLTDEQLERRVYQRIVDRACSTNAFFDQLTAVVPPVNAAAADCCDISAPLPPQKQTQHGGLLEVYASMMRALSQSVKGTNKDTGNMLHRTTAAGGETDHDAESVSPGNGNNGDGGGGLKSRIGPLPVSASLLSLSCGVHSPPAGPPLRTLAAPDANSGGSFSQLSAESTVDHFLHHMPAMSLSSWEQSPSSAVASAWEQAAEGLSSLLQLLSHTGSLLLPMPA
eukprot:CAMPEP_0170077634 /NCGR_PEP_ID=MMETSP0019_2-20121128/14410_1 /TAXON_ID=98059 /ORGANISM="Dinobryon sp., Strain UTEXLB2267" /LENGTH=250 /DNA_ID=CAMNT_0010290077 /DNA_START=1324 /DNA_END=2076 /DNA_ORIENTATION=-